MRMGDEVLGATRSATWLPGPPDATPTSPPPSAHSRVESRIEKGAHSERKNLGHPGSTLSARRRHCRSVVFSKCPNRTPARFSRSRASPTALDTAAPYAPHVSASAGAPLQTAWLGALTPGRKLRGLSEPESPPPLLDSQRVERSP